MITDDRIKRVRSESFLLTRQRERERERGRVSESDGGTDDERK